MSGTGLDNPDFRQQLMAEAADHATGSAEHLREIFDQRDTRDNKCLVVEDRLRGVRNHAVAYLQHLYKAPVYFTQDPEQPWMDGETAWVVNLRDGWHDIHASIDNGAVTYTLFRMRQPYLAAVVPLFSEHRYMAAAGLGSWRQKEQEEPEKITVSTTYALAKSIFSFGLPADDLSAAAFRPARLFRAKVSSLRLSGCSSLDLVNVAYGVSQGHFEAGVTASSVAAGVLILREAGGVTTTWKGNDIYPYRRESVVNIASSNHRIHGQLVYILSKFKTPYDEPTT